MWGSDLTREYSILEAGLSRFVRLKKDEFVGKEALLMQKETGVPQEFVTLEIDVTDADALGSEPISAMEKWSACYLRMLRSQYWKESGVGLCQKWKRRHWNRVGNRNTW
jgi:glycine cleavage system aminomethyltransferase T